MGKRVTTIPATISKFTASPLTTQKKRKVAAYARVSTDHEEQQSSYEAQVDYYTDYIKGRSDWQFVAVYADEGITGCNTTHRDGFNSMVQDALAGKIDLIHDVNHAGHLMIADFYGDIPREIVVGVALILIQTEFVIGLNLPYCNRNLAALFRINGGICPFRSAFEFEFVALDHARPDVSCRGTSPCHLSLVEITAVGNIQFSSHISGSKILSFTKFTSSWRENRPDRPRPAIRKPFRMQWNRSRFLAIIPLRGVPQGVPSGVPPATGLSKRCCRPAF